MGNPRWIELMTESLKKHVGEAKMKDIMNGCEILDKSDEKQSAEWMRSAMVRLDRHIPSNDIKINIMTGCACECCVDHMDELKRTYRESGDIDKLLDVMHGRVFMVRPVREGNVVYITKAPRFPKEHAEAETPGKKRYYFCHCDHARAASDGMSLTYCYCGAGWCKKIWEGILERPVRVDITKSVLQGDDVCQFAVHL
ncbi:MAG: hypothetical protein KKG33_06085 [candidate division Zixibacteria bacterium]|nr:hypothetical protein [candidate division Zixibacteria bacterium]MBU1469596.1 hypothetical protein [candidate division Zixibacteria bacterium]MBU2625111.1 hypothetical protein [candidate division Zixibacteria bacterium]